MFSFVASITLRAQSSKSSIDKQMEEAGYYLEVANDTEKGLKILSQAKDASKDIGYKEGILRSGKILTFYQLSSGVTTVGKNSLPSDPPSVSN